MSQESPEQIFAVIVPSAASMTAPIAAGVEMSKLFIMASKKYMQLAEQTRILHSTDEQGHDVVTVIDNPDLKWWFDQSRKIASDIAKITANIQIKEVETRVKIADMLLNSTILKKEDQERMIQEYYKQRDENV
jgi:hypothetical protein